MSSNIDYREIRSMSDLKRARARVDRQLFVIHHDLERDYCELSDMLSFEYWVDRLAMRVPALVPVIQSLFSGYSFIATLINRFRK